MKYRPLGNTSINVSEITLGTMTWGQQNTEADAHAQLDLAVEQGVNLIDTAEMYPVPPKAETQGLTERYLGTWLKQAGHREKVLVATKAAGPARMPHQPRHVRDGINHLDRKGLTEALNLSLQRLQTDYVDLYQAHRFDYETPLEETFQAFADIVRQGKALYIGVSEWTEEQLRAGHALATQLNVQLISNQPEYSALWRVIEEKIVPASVELGVSQIVWSPIAQGVLTGKYKPGAELPEGSRATDDKGGAGAMKRWLTDDVLTRVQGLAPIAAELSLSSAQLAVAWVLQNPNVAAAIIGASRPAQVAENVKASGVVIPAELMTRIDEVLGDSIERDPSHTDTRSPKAREA
jgi:aryl-alcohol dehydrogenase-like predicted oxidoreductase